MLKRLDALRGWLEARNWIALLLSALFLQAVFSLPSQRPHQHQRDEPSTYEANQDGLLDAPRQKLAEPETNAKADTHEADGTEETTSGWLSRNYNEIVALGTLILAAFAFGQWRDSRLSNERAQRAYMCIEGATGRYEDNIFKVTLQFRNAGQTPAYRFDNWVGCGIHEYPLVEPLKDPETRTPHSVMVGPGLGKEVSIARSKALTSDERAVLEAKTFAIYFFGRAKYFDVFDRERMTEFCMYTFESSGHGIGLKNYRSGNDAD